MQALPPACYRRVLLPFPRFLLESRDYGRITTGESCTGDSCFKNPGLYTALKSAVIKGCFAPVLTVQGRLHRALNPISVRRLCHADEAL